MKLKAIIFLIPVVILMLAWFLFSLPQEKNLSSVITPSITPKAIPIIVNKVTPTSLPDSKLYIQGLSFAAQAPFRDWKDPRQQDACEEASAMAAVYWARGKSFTREEALTEILDMVNFQIVRFGQARDTSSQDTLDRIIKGYFDYPYAKLENVSTSKDIINWLSGNMLVIVPANGQTLGNRYFTPPGPDRHMVVIRGYDYITNEFITNDVGTVNGENYRYKSKVLFESIRDYPTGDHLPITVHVKNAIIVWKI